MRAYRLMAAGRAELVELPRPQPGPGEVLLRVLAAGVCRTDLDLLRTGGPALALPVTLGHEIVGEIVGGPRRGAVVAVYELLGCGLCRACAGGHDNVCRELVPGAIGVTRDGGMADHVVVPARNLVALGDLDPVHAAPLTDAGMTAPGRRRTRTVAARTGGDGRGGRGRRSRAPRRAVPARDVDVRVLAVDVDSERLDFAAGFGADAGVLTGPDAADGILAANGGRKVDVVFDFVGAQESLDLAATVTGRGGAIVITGAGEGRLSIAARRGAAERPIGEVTIVHTFGGSRGDLERALALAEAGRVRTHVEVSDLSAAGRVLADLDAGKVLGRAVLVPG